MVKILGILKNNLYYFIALFLVVFCLSYVVHVTNYIYEKNKELNYLIKTNTLNINKTFSSNQPEEDRKLGEFVKLLMSEVNTPLTPLKKDVTTQMIVRVGNSIFDKPEHRHQFAIVLAIESKFNNKAKSSAGAIGIAQIMPQYADEFSKLCGFKLKKGDIYDTEINMLLGACQLRFLLEHPDINGNMPAALVAYNAGKNSTSFKKLLGLENIEVVETVNYIAKFSYLEQKVKTVLEQQKGE